VSIVIRLLLFAFFAASASPLLAQQTPKTVYLTFDDGPQLGTSEVLDVLSKLQAHAAFFLTGSNAGTAGGQIFQTDLVKRELADGHEVGSHCYIHKPMTKADYTATYGDLSTEAQQKAFRENFTRNLDYFRARLDQPDFTFKIARLPGDGFTFPILVHEIEKLGMRHFAWQFEFATGPKGFGWLKALDWQGIQGVRAETADLPPNGSIILFHDRHWGGEDQAKLEAILTLLKQNGYTFGKLSDLGPRKPAHETPHPKPDTQPQ